MSYPVLRRNRTQAELDDAAAAALYRVSKLPKADRAEFIGLLYDTPAGVAFTEPRGGANNANARGAFAIPAGSLLALYHNHPPVRDKRGFGVAGGGEEFSPDDIRQAKHLGVPSYITTPSGRLFRYDPATGRIEEVLALIPIQEMIMAMARDILGRAPNDPRGLRLEGPTPQVSSDEPRDLPKFDPVRPQAIEPRRILANR